MGLKDCPQIICLVFMHMPVNHPTSNHVMGENDKIMTEQAKELERLLIENNVKEVFTGHVHLPQEYDLNGLHTSIVGALGLHTNRTSMLEIEFQNGTWGKTYQAF